MRRLLLLTFSMLPSLAQARAQADLPYGLGEAFSTALRFARIDRGCKITDKDPDAAFFTFECQDDQKARRGAVELWRTDRGVRVQVSLGDDPHYMELRWVELIERKLKEERGTPPAPNKPAPSPAPRVD
jgi:hypothetical protein